MTISHNGWPDNFGIGGRIGRNKDQFLFEAFFSFLFCFCNLFFKDCREAFHFLSQFSEFIFFLLDCGLPLFNLFQNFCPFFFQFVFKGLDLLIVGVFLNFSLLVPFVNIFFLFALSFLEPFPLELFKFFLECCFLFFSSGGLACYFFLECRLSGLEIRDHPLAFGR